ncbi:MAG: SGNH/GDSL hydrolase family protein [Candidatus Zixiibacteriota bacterium]|nr:MAG: SGNH/GDSL hydrolase family protein [candidate division Zixibacteria bacterium]
MTRLARFTVNLAVLGITLSLMVAASELFLRVFGQQRFERGHQKLFVRYDSDLGWSKIPGKQARHITIEYDIEEHLNSKGIRGPEYSYTKGPNESRVIMLGDSFVEGYSVEFDQTSSQVLEQILTDRSGHNYTVINGGTGGYSTDQEYLYFKDELCKYHPDLTILMFYANDVIGNVRDHHYRGNKPLFRQRDGELVLTNVPVPKPVANTAEELLAKQDLFSHTKQWLFANSRLYALVRRAITGDYSLHLLAIKLGLAEIPGTPEDPIPVPDELKVWARFYDADTKQAWQLTEVLIKRLRQAVESTGSRFLVYYIPTSAAIYDDEWQATKKMYKLSDGDWNVNQVAVELKAICKRNGIDFVDPTSQFLAEADRLRRHDERVYYPLDRHWTPEGHRLTAEILADHIDGGYDLAGFSADDSE